MTQFKFWMTALSTVSIAGSIVLGSTSAEACPFRKFKSVSDSSNSPNKLSLNIKSSLTSKQVGIAGGIAAASAGLFGLGLFYHNRREAELATTSFESLDEINDQVTFHPEAPGGELDVTDNTTTSVEELTQKEIVLTK